MITKNKPLIVVFVIGMIAYLIVDLFFNEALLYLVGGILGSSLKAIGLQNGFSVAWLLILIGIIFLYQKINIAILKWLLLIFIWILLYWIDVILYDVLPDIASSTVTYLHIGLSVLSKSVLLAMVYYRSNKKETKSAQ